MTHDTGLTYPPPPSLPEGATRTITVLPGRGGGGALEASQDRHRYSNRTGPPEQNRQTEAMAEQGAQKTMAVQGAPEAMVVLGALEAMAGGPYVRGLIPLGPATTAGALLPPPKKEEDSSLRGYPQEQGPSLG